MTNVDTVSKAFADLREALANLAERRSASDAVALAVTRLGTAIDVAVAALETPAPPDADLIAEHNRLVDEVNAAITQYNSAVEAVNAVGSSCQFCGLTIEDGEDSVPTAQIPEENIQMYGHADCHARVTAADAAPSVEAFLAAEQAERNAP